MRCDAISHTKVLDWDLIREKGYTWVGSMPVPLDGEWTFYVRPDTETAVVEELHAALHRACTPLPNNEIVKGLASLMVLCKIKGMTGDETSLALDLFRQKLADYPADAVIFALTTWPEHNTFFPSWHELKRMTLAHCWARMRMRDRLGEVLQKRKLKL